MSEADKNLEITLPEDNLRVFVDREGYWFGNEVIEFIDFIKAKKWHRAADLGCGDGVIALLLGRRKLADEIWAIDVSKDSCHRSRHNVEINNLTGRIEVLNRNIRTLKSVFQRGSFDLITANPPFFSIGNDHKGLNEAQENARQETLGSLRFFLQAAEYLGARNADVYFIYHPSRLDVFFNELKQTQIRCKHLQILHHDDGRALFVLCHGVKGGQTGMKILPPITLKESIKSKLEKI